jgi:hypothetical protein
MRCKNATLKGHFIGTERSFECEDRPSVGPKNKEKRKKKPLYLIYPPEGSHRTLHYHIERVHGYTETTMPSLETV